MLVVKRLYGWSYEETERFVVDSLVLRQFCRVLGGGTFSRSSSFGHWHEDVRALGFLRPTWGLAYDQLYAWSVAALV